MTPTLERLIERVKMLSPEEQARVLDFVEQSSMPVGESGKDFIARAQQLTFDPEFLDELSTIVEAMRNQIDDEQAADFD